MTNATIVINSERLMIKLGELPDAEKILAFEIKNRAHFAPFCPKHEDSFFTLEIQQEKLKAKLNSPEKNLGFYGYLKEDPDKIIAYSGLSEIIRGVMQSCFVSWMMDKDYQGKGLMLEMMEKVLSFGFTELKLHRIEANMLKDNIRSIRLAEAIGMRKEAEKKAYLRINGKWQDHFGYAIIEEEFFAKYAKEL